MCSIFLCFIAAGKIPFRNAQTPFNRGILAAAFDGGTDMRAADADVGKASVIKRAQFGHGAAVAEVVTNGVLKFHFHKFLRWCCIKYAHTDAKNTGICLHGRHAKIDTRRLDRGEQLPA